jgi:hypothetical protein
LLTHNGKATGSRDHARVVEQTINDEKTEKYIGGGVRVVARPYDERDTATNIASERVQSPKKYRKPVADLNRTKWGRTEIQK